MQKALTTWPYGTFQLFASKGLAGLPAAPFTNSPSSWSRPRCHPNPDTLPSPFFSRLVSPQTLTWAPACSLQQARGRSGGALPYFGLSPQLPPLKLGEPQWPGLGLRYRPKSMLGRVG